MGPRVRFARSIGPATASKRSYTGFVESLSGIEDDRGVDISQIRRLLRMSVEERVRYMVQVANTLMEVRSTAVFIDVPRVR